MPYVSFLRIRWDNANTMIEAVRKVDTTGDIFFYPVPFENNISSHFKLGPISKEM